MDSIKTIEDVKRIFESSDIQSIKDKLINLIRDTKIINNPDKRKKLKAFFINFLEYIVFEVEHTCVNEIIFNFFDCMNEMSFMYLNELNVFFQEKIYLLKENILENKEKIINLSFLLIYFTKDLNQTNQIISNYIILYNKILLTLDIDLEDESKTEQFIFKILLLKISELLNSNIKVFNPFLLNQIENLLFIFNKSNHTIYSSENKLSFKYQDHKQSISDGIRVVLTIIINIINNLNDDINLDNILLNIINILKSSKFDLISKTIIDTYLKVKIKNFYKKSIQINFLTIKRKSIPELDPEIDGEIKNMSKILDSKLKKTRKQAIRNLKKEARVIDQQRQDSIKNLDIKRKEELKASNQFIEQTNIDYKKLITSQTKKRFKLKNNK